jgi:exodeoxyribonuclease VII small subunit
LTPAKTEAIEADMGKSTAKGAKATGASDEPFEQVLGRLEGLVERLEGGELSLEDSLKAYEEGVGLVRDAQGRLDAMESRLQELREDGSTAPLSGDDDG